MTTDSAATIFGVNVFNDSAMREYLQDDAYYALKKTVEEGVALEPELADAIAAGMKEWAMSKGATHYTHWFQPMNGFTAEKHEAFLFPTKDGNAISEFSGKMLVKGESDASSFPSGGLRATFEARGYTMWDSTSPAFLKEDTSGVTLCIPTAFGSYHGEALDEKTPLLRSMEAINKQALRILKLFGDHDVKRVQTTIGAEQEYFLIDLHLFKKRTDLVVTGRTLFGTCPPKTQELEDHYYGTIEERTASFMKELDIALWKMGISAKTKHNEAAPAQHELAPYFTTSNIASDQNQLIMETMKKVANRHGLACLLHEKPFDYINGSGKHNNWSLTTDDGQNLLNPGKTPYDNAKFLLFLCAVIAAIDRHAGLLRLSAACQSNDLRLGACEAPPAIISIFLGEHLNQVLDRIVKGKGAPDACGRIMDFGVPSLPQLSADATDRNRTSPFAFTGNKFEFRMLGSSMSISWTNTVLNTIVAETLDEIATRIEGSSDFDKTVHEILAEIIKQNGRVIFDGNSYSQEWVAEAEKRGLPNLATTASTLVELLKPDTQLLFEKYHVYSRQELHARYEIMVETYIKNVRIEARTMILMAEKEIYPAVSKYAEALASAVARFHEVGMTGKSQKMILQRLLSEIDLMWEALEDLKKSMEEAAEYQGYSVELAYFCCDRILPQMKKLRGYSDNLEKATDKKYWPFPTYEQLLFDI